MDYLNYFIESDEFISSLPLKTHCISTTGTENINKDISVLVNEQKNSISNFIRQIKELLEKLENTTIFVMYYIDQIGYDKLTIKDIPKIIFSGQQSYEYKLHPKITITYNIRNDNFCMTIDGNKSLDLNYCDLIYEIYNLPDNQGFELNYSVCNQFAQLSKHYNTIMNDFEQMGYTNRNNLEEALISFTTNLQKDLY